MICPTCQTANPDGARFCFNCGSALAQSCPNCGASQPAGAKFCFNCGQQLGPQPASKPAVQPAVEQPSQPTRLHQFIPKELLGKLESARANGAMEGERRIVTMLFCDIKGSTAAASHLDPEEWVEIVNGAFEHMIRPVYRYEGTVARLMGDGLLAFFGAPIAHEDDPQRAILAGLEIVQAIRPYGDQMRQQWGIDLDVRVGINTGLVVVGAVGSDLRMEYTALGDAINLAARMEQTAQPGAVQISEATHRLVAPLFDFEALGAVEVKGKDAPVQAYRVLGRKAEPGQLRGIAGLESPLVGRAGEMAALRDAVEALQNGHGQVVSVMGEAGLGKSRLIAELRRAAAGDPDLRVQWVEGRSLSYETAAPYAPFVGMLNDCFGLQVAQSDADKYLRLKGQLEALFPGRGDEMAPFLATLLELPVPAADAERVKYLEPPMLRGLIFAHAGAFVERLAAAQPLVMYFDDLHWIDPTSLDLLEALLPSTERVPLMILAAFRPRRQEPSWRFHATAQRDYSHLYSAISLQPLDESQSRELVGNLLHIEDLPEKVRRLILVKAEGNPFFVEEVIRSLLDSGLVVRDNGHWRATKEIATIALPDTLGAVITARLDRLDDPARHIAQAASVIGREFGFDTLADIFDTPDLLEDGLRSLQRRDLVREKSRLPERVFSFKHVLTQEAAYNSILLSRRRDLHRKVAESMQRRRVDRPADVARHFLDARQPGRAVPYLVQAGDRAARSYSTVEAREFFTNAVDLRSAVEDISVVRRAYEGLGAVLTLTNDMPQAVETYQAMLSLAESRDDLPMRVSALNKLAAVYALRMGQFAQAEQFLARAERLARDHREMQGVAEASIIRCQMCTAMADFDGVIQHMDEVVEISSELGVKEFMAMGMEHVASSLMFLTRFDEAWDKGQEALTMAREIGDREHEAWLLTTTIPVCLLVWGDFDAARKHLHEGIEIARRIGALPPVIEGAWMLGEMARWQGRYEEAIDFGRQSLEAALPLEEFMPFFTVQPLGSLGMAYLEISPAFTDQVAEFHRHALRLLENPAGVAGGGTAWADLGFCALALGDVEAAEQFLQKGLHTPTMFMHLERPRFLAGSALIALARGRQTEALRWVDEARAFAESRSMHHVYPLIDLTTGQVVSASGDHAAALACFEQAESSAAALKMLTIVWQARAGAAQAVAAMSDAAEAGARRRAAEAVVQEIAGLFQSQDLRQAYLASTLAKLGATESRL